MLPLSVVPEPLAQRAFFFSAGLSRAATRPAAANRATSCSSALARCFQRALLSSKNRMRFLSTFMAALAVRHLAFHCVRLVSKNRSNLRWGLLYGSPEAVPPVSARACNPFLLLLVVIGHPCLQHKNGTIVQGKQLPQYQRFYQPTPTLPSWLKLLPVLNERQRRLYAAQKVLELGHGGLKQVHVWTGRSRPTLLKGLAELRGEPEMAEPERVRGGGGGRMGREERCGGVRDEV